MPHRDIPGPGPRFFSDEMAEQALPGFLERPRKRKIILLLLTIVVFVIDYVTGPAIRFPAFFVPPIILVAWYDGFIWGGLAGVGIIVGRFSLEQWIWPRALWPLEGSFVTVCSNMIMILILVWYAARAGELSREVRVLWGLLPICMHCHRIRNESNEWERFEAYFMIRSDAEFTHGICPRCAEEKSKAR